MLVGKAILLHALNKTHSFNSQKQNNVISLIIILRQKANISSPLDSCTKLGQSLLKCSTEPQILHPPPAHRIGKQIKSVRMKFKVLTNFEGIKFQSNSLIFSPSAPRPAVTTLWSHISLYLKQMVMVLGKEIFQNMLNWHYKTYMKYCATIHLSLNVLQIISRFLNEGG